MFPKTQRIQDPELLALVRTLPCLCCLKTPSEAHHVTTRGAGGHDLAENLMPLCTQHHREWHDLGPVKMMGKYPVVETWLELAERHDVLSKKSLGAVCDP